MCRLPHLCEAPEGEKRRGEAIRKERICFFSVKGSFASKGIICPSCGHLHVAFVSHTAHYFSLRSTQTTHRCSAFLLFCSHILDSLWFGKREINVVVTLYSKQLSPYKENVPLSRHPVILQRVRMYKLVLRKSAKLSSSSMHGVCCGSFFAIGLLRFVGIFSCSRFILFYFSLSGRFLLCRIVSYLLAKAPWLNHCLLLGFGQIL